MCVASSIGDYWGQRLPQQYPWVNPIINPIPMPGTGPYVPIPNSPTKEEFDALRREVEQLKQLMIAAKKFDEATGQPDCEMAEKIAVIKKVADFVGVDLSELGK